MGAEVASCCMAGDVGPGCDECGCPLLVGDRPARDWALGTHLADERYEQGSSAVAGACKPQRNSIGDVRGDRPLRAVLGMRDLPASAGLWRGACGKELWSVLISPITEELFFRGLMYNGFLFVGRNLAWKRAFEIFVVFCVASIFAFAHARSGIYLELTMVAGIVYGLCRWKSGSVIPAIVCHCVFNALVMWTFGR